MFYNIIQIHFNPKGRQFDLIHLSLLCLISTMLYLLTYDLLYFLLQSLLSFFQVGNKLILANVKYSNYCKFTN